MVDSDTILTNVNMKVKIILKKIFRKRLTMVWWMPIIENMRLHIYIKREKIKPADFARKIGVTERSIYNYMRGKTPRIDTARKIEKVSKGRVTFLELLK